MRILILSQWFYPEPFYKGITFAEALRDRGHDVEVLTGFPNYPGGKLHAGYKIRPFKRETINGIRVNRVALYPSHDTSGLKRFVNYASFALSAAVFGPWLVKKPDVIYVYHPPGTIGLPMAVLRFLKRAPVVYDIQDMWPDTIASTGMMSNQRVLRVLGNWMQWVYRRCDRIAVLSPGFKRLLTEKGVPADKIDVIFNWNDDRTLSNANVDPKIADQLGIQGDFIVMFAGTMGKAQAIDSVLDAAALCWDQDHRIRFVFVGGGIERDRLEQAAKLKAPNNTQFVPRQPPENMAPLFERASVLLVHLKDDFLFEITIPSKIQAYMAAGKPILVAVKGDAANLIADAGAGIACEPEDPQSIAEAVLSLAAMPKEKLESMGLTGKHYYEQNLQMEVGVQKFATLFEEAVAGPRS